MSEIHSIPTPEMLAELAAKHERVENHQCGCCDVPESDCDWCDVEWPCDTAVLLDALAAEKAARQEAEQESADWEAKYEQAADDCNAQAARADEAERDVAHWRDRATRMERRLVEAQRERDALRNGQSVSQHWRENVRRAEQECDQHKRRAEVHIERELSAKARVAALEAGITRLAEQAKRWEDQRSASDGYPAVVAVRHADLRALTEKEADHA